MKSPSRYEQDLKDVKINTLKAENFELKQKERDYHILNSQLIDLEHRFRLLQDEKIRAQKDNIEKEGLLLSDNARKQERVKLLQDDIWRNQKMGTELETELRSYKELYSNKTLEIEDLKKKIANSTGESVYLSKEKRMTQAELDMAIRERNVSQLEADRLAVINDKLAKDTTETNLDEKDMAIEAARLRRQLDDLYLKIDMAQKDKTKTESDLEIAHQGKNMNREEADRLLIQNKRLEDEVAALKNKAKGMELELDRLLSRKDATRKVVEDKDRELRSVKASVSNAETSSYLVRGDISKTRKDLDTYQQLLDKYKGDVEFQKRLKDQELIERLNIDKEKKELEREALHKDLAARSAKRELEKVQTGHNYLIESRMELNKELQALQGHTQLLEQQNAQLHGELDNFVSIDEKVRRDLDRKPIVNYVKTKNEQEYLNSISKVRNSQSPEKRFSPSKSSYISPSKY